MTLLLPIAAITDHVEVSAPESRWQAPPGYRRLLNAGAYAVVLYFLALIGYEVSHGWLREAFLALGWLLSVVLLVSVIGTTIWYRKATGRSGWAVVRANLKEEFRFGHKRWHRVALIVLAIPVAYMALIFGAGAGEVGVAAGFGGAATILILLALLAHRKHRPTR